MLARVAENLYWMARYIERAEDTARLINAHAQLLLDLPHAAQTAWAPLVHMSGDDSEFAGRYSRADARSVIRFLVGDRKHGNSIVNCLARARENARSVRDTLPREAWEQINDMYLAARSGAAGARQFDYLRAIILDAQRITGLLAGTMNHDAAYAFIRAGRNLERGDMTTRIIDVRCMHLLPLERGGIDPFETIQWIGVLKSLSAYQMYRQYMRGAVAGPGVLQFLLQNGLFPRAFVHCLGEVERAVVALPPRPSLLAALAGVREHIEPVQWPHVLKHAALRALLAQLQAGLDAVHREIDSGYFHAPAEPPAVAGAPPARAGAAPISTAVSAPQE